MTPFVSPPERKLRELLSGLPENEAAFVGEVAETFGAVLVEDRAERERERPIKNSASNAVRGGVHFPISSDARSSASTAYAPFAGAAIRSIPSPGEQEQMPLIVS